MPKYLIYYPLYAKTDEYIEVEATDEETAIRQAYTEVKYAGCQVIDIEEIFIIEETNE